MRDLDKLRDEIIDISDRIALLYEMGYKQGYEDGQKTAMKILEKQIKELETE